MKEAFENTEMKPREKLKVTKADIIVTGTKKKPYFEIKYKEVGKENYNIGFGSYDLNNVFNWREEEMEIVSEVEVEYGNWWIDVKDRLPENEGYYLTCDHKGNIHVFYHHPSYVANGSNMAFGICKNHPQFYQPIAWMELPKPYTRKKGE